MPNTNGKRYSPYRQFIGAVVPEWLLRRTDVSLGAKLCFARLAQFAGKREYAFPGRATLAKALGVSEQSVRDYLRELTGLGLIETERMGSGNFSRYYFLNRDGWVEFRKRRQEDRQMTDRIVSDRQQPDGQIWSN